MRHKIRQGSETGWLAAAGVTALLLLVGMQAGGGYQIPDSQLRPTAETIIELHAQLDDSQLSHYRWLRRLDMLFPAAYGLFFGLSLHRLVRRSHSIGVDQPRRGSATWQRSIPILPLAAAGSDYLENLLLMHSLARHPEPGWSAAAAGWFTLIKWLLLATTGLAAIGLALNNNRRRIRQRNR